MLQKAWLDDRSHPSAEEASLDGVPGAEAILHRPHALHLGQLRALAQLGMYRPAAAHPVWTA